MQKWLLDNQKDIKTRVRNYDEEMGCYSIGFGNLFCLVACANSTDSLPTEQADEPSYEVLRGE